MSAASSIVPAAAFANAANASAAPPPDTPKMAYFNAHTNPQKPPLLPPSMMEQLIAPVVTFIASLFVLLAIKPPFVQKRSTKGKPTGHIQWMRIFSVSFVMALFAVLLPLGVRWFLKEQSK